MLFCWFASNAQAGLLGGIFGAPVDIQIEFRDQENLKQVVMKDENGNRQLVYLFTGLDSIAGTVHVNLKNKKKVEHIGLKIELVGQIGSFFSFLS